MINYAIHGLKIGRPRIVGAGQTEIEFFVRNVSSSNQRCRITPDSVKKERGELTPDGLAIEAGPREAPKSVQFIYNVQCNVPYREREDSVIFRLKDGQTAVPFRDEDRSVESYGLVARVKVAMSSYDFVTYAFKRLGKLLTGVSTLASTLTTIIATYLLKLNLFSDVLAIVEIFASGFIIAMVVLVVAVSFSIGKEPSEAAN